MMIRRKMIDGGSAAIGKREKRERDKISERFIGWAAQRRPL